MKFLINGEETNGEAYSLGYDNDLFDGILVNLPNHYVHLSDHIEQHRGFMDAIEDEVEHFDLTCCEVDWSQPPHSWVLKSIEKAIVQTAEQVCAEACE